MKNFFNSIFGSPAPKASTSEQASYLKHFRPYPKHTPIDEIRFWVVDTETTGINPKTDIPISIGAIPVQGRQLLVADSWEMLIKQQVELEGETVAIHGLLGKAIALGEDPQAVGNAILEKVGSSVLVAHHADFDSAMITKLLQPFALQNSWIDTVDLAKRLEIPPHQRLSAQEAKAFTLDPLLQRYNIVPTDRHTAAGDALLTAQLLVKLLHRLEKRGITRWGDLKR